jgi:hypothetical protein
VHPRPRRVALCLTLIAGSLANAADSAAAADGTTDAAARAGADAVPSPRLPRASSTPELLRRAVAEGRLDRTTADAYLAYALADSSRLPDAYRASGPWRGTLALLRLERGSRRHAAEPISGEAEAPHAGGRRAATCSTSTGRLPDRVSTAHFFIQYDGAHLGGGLTIDDYAEALETTWATEIDAFGWAAPPVRHAPPGDRYYVRIDRLSPGLYGYVASSGTYAGEVGDNPNTAWKEPDAAASCMVLNEDFGGPGFPSAPSFSLESTTAHEFNHAIQYGYGDLTGPNRPDAVFIEGGATWMEDEVFDASDDNQYYLWPRFASSMATYSASPYPYWVVLRGLLERLGHAPDGTGAEQAMQDFWELLSTGQSRNVGALGDAMAMMGLDLAAAYRDFAIAAKFSKSCDASYVEPLCFEEGASYVSHAGVPETQGHVSSIGDAAKGSVPDNYALSWIRLPRDGGPFTLTVKNTSSGGTIGADAVCDLGPGSGLRIDSVGAAVDGGATASAPVDPAGCQSLVAVITNVRQSSRDPHRSTLRGFRVETSA